MAGPQVDIVLNRIDRVYRPGDKVSGAVVVTTSSSMNHSGIKMQVEGNVTLQLSARSIGLFEAFYSSLKPINLIQMEFEVSSSGKIPAGTTEFPFEFTLKPTQSSDPLYDTYHGVYVNVQYMLSVEMLRGMMMKSLKKQREFVVEQHHDEELAAAEKKAKPFQFKIAPESLQNVKESSKKKIPEFLFEGHFDHTNCDIQQPLTGEIVIKKCAVEIKSIELQLVRVESCTYMEGEAREATEIQNIQIADGNVIQQVAIPLYMVFPRLFTCQTTTTKSFKVEFEVNLIVLFADNHMVTENIPLKLIR